LYTLIRSSCREYAHSVFLQNLIAFSYREDYYRQRTADLIPVTEAMIVITVVKSLVILYCLSIVLAVHPAAASTTQAKQEVQQDVWLHYATDEDGTDYSFNPAKVQRLQGNLVRVWVNAKYSEKNQKYTEGQFQWEINCSKKTMRGLAATAKKKDGTSATITQSSDWSNIPAESTAENLFEITCISISKDKKK
jgi:hypothetical protein